MNRVRKYTGIQSFASPNHWSSGNNRATETFLDESRITSWSFGRSPKSLVHCKAPEGLSSEEEAPQRNESSSANSFALPHSFTQFRRQKGSKNEAILRRSVDTDAGAGRRGIDQGAGGLAGGEGPRVAISGVDEKGRAGR